MATGFSRPSNLCSFEIRIDLKPHHWAPRTVAATEGDRHLSGVAKGETGDLSSIALATEEVCFV
jgi:hypothetical protein